MNTDTNGYLVDYREWTTNIAETLAAQESLILTPFHYQLIFLARDFYSRYQRTPSIRVLVNLLKETHPPEQASSLYIQHLFPKGAAKQLSKVAGLPKPIHCT